MRTTQWWCHWYFQDVPRRAHRGLVCRRRGPGLVGAGRSPAPGRGHRGPGHPATRYLVTNLPRPGGPREADSPHPAASLAEIAGIYGIATGSSRATSKSKTSWAGPTSRSAPTPPSAATRPWSTAPSVSAGTPGSPIRRPVPSHRGPGQAAERGGHPPPYRRHRPGRGHCGRYAPGLPPGSRCSAGGRHGQRCPRPRRCKPCSAQSRRVTACTSTSRINKLPLVGAVTVDDGGPGFPQDLQVEGERPVFHVTNVEPDCLLPSQV